MNLTLTAAPKAVADGAQTMIKIARGDRKARKRFRKNSGQVVRVAAVSGAGVATAVVLGARRRRQALVGKAVGAVSGSPKAGDLNDPTLARKVETEIFRGEDAPKGSVDVNAENGVIYLRGEVKHPEDIEALGKAARKVDGVKEVKNLLHLPKTDAKMKK
jgi:osmotically-inducible protein OsmY